MAPSPQPQSNAFKSIVRSLTPFAVSSAVSAIAHFGYHISNAVALQIIVAVGAALSIVLHALETQFPWIGVLLGYIGAPVYAPSGKTSLKTQVAMLESQLAALTTAQSEAASPTLPTSAPIPVPGPTTTTPAPGGTAPVTP
jgi:hypothetical protein